MKTSLPNVPISLLVKTFLIAFICIGSHSGVNAQIVSRKEYKALTKSNATGDKVYKSVKSDDDELVSENTFNKVIKKDLRYIILGDETAFSGFSLDVSDKTKAKISGNIPFFERGIHNIEIEGGQKDSDIPLFESGKYSGQLDVKYNWQIIPKWNSYGFQTNANHVADTLFKKRQDELNKLMLDTLSAICAIVYFKDPTMYEVATAPHLIKIKKSDSLTKGDYPDWTVPGHSDWTTDANTIIEDKVFARDTTLFKSLILKYFPSISIVKADTSKIDSLASKKPITTDTLPPIPDYVKFRNKMQKIWDYKKDLLFQDFQHILERTKKRNELNTEAEIDIAKQFWLNKHYRWFTISPSVNFQGYNIYGFETATKPVPTKETMSVVKGKITAWFSSYDLYKKAGSLFRFGPELVYGRFLTNFTEVKYYERDTLRAEGNGNVVIKESTKSGLYRDATSSKDFKVYLNAHIEYFLLPRKTFVPGFNIKFSYLKDELSTTDPYQARIQAGFIFNLLNKEKDKPVISLLPYFRFSNLRDQFIKDGDSMRMMTAREKISVGITIGLPIKGLTFEKDE